MILRDMGVTITFVIVVMFMIVGIGSRYITDTDDSAIEECSEAVIEQQLGLEPGSIDFTPNSKE
jgi:hypothetical protein